MTNSFGVDDAAVNFRFTQTKLVRTYRAESFRIVVCVLHVENTHIQSRLNFLPLFFDEFRDTLRGDFLGGIVVLRSVWFFSLGGFLTSSFCPKLFCRAFLT